MTTASTLLFALALIVGEVLLVLILRRQLISEVDRGVEARLNDLLDFVEVIYEVEDRDPSDRIELSGLTGIDEIAAIFDLDGDLVSISDNSGSPGSLLDVADDDIVTVSLAEFEYTDGTSSMRLGSLADFGFVGEVVFNGRVLTEAEIDALTDEEYEQALDESGQVLDFAVVAKSLASVDRTVSTIATALLVGTPFLIATFAALAWWLAGRTLRPVERTRREVEEISSGDLARRVSTSGRGDEIDRLGMTMNDMLARIEAGQTQQRRFVADASHELRTPLAAIATELDVNAAHPDAATWPDTAERLRSTVSRMQRLVDDLQLLARSDAGVSSAPATSAVSLGDLVLEGAYAGGPGAAVTMGTVDEIRVEGNEDQLRRIVDNLVANARRHATSHVRISLTAEHDPAEQAPTAELRVDDDGAGIAPLDREQVFERFVRLDEGRTRDRGGSGLGLAICRDLVAAHDGTLRIEDSDLGGASFVVRLPIS